MAVLNKDQILAADDRPRETVEVPEWGGSVIVRALGATERDAWEAGVVGDGKQKNLQNIRARLCASCLVDEGGSQLFSEREAVLLGQKSGSVMDRLFDIAAKLSKLTPAAVETLAKN